MPDLSIIIVNYNVKEFLLNLLDSLKKATNNLSHEIIIVDNASDDGSVEIIEEKYPSVKLIKNKKNVGFGTANNQGIKLSQGKYTLLINPDTIVKENIFTKLIQFIESKPDAGMVGCKVLNPDGSLQLSCRRGFPGPWTSFTKVTGLSKLFPKSKLFAKYNLTYLNENGTYRVDAISGAFMFTKKEILEKVGGFDTQFFMYGEDLDLCYRIQKEGLSVYYFHETEIIHYKGESTRRSSLEETRVFYDAMYLFVKKHFSSSFIVETILKSAIALRKIIAFTNVYRMVLIGIIVDLVLITTAIFLAENFYLSDHWKGFPDFVKPWVYIVPSFVQVLISGLLGAYKKNSLSVLRCLNSLFIGLLFLTSSTFFLKQFAFSRAIVLIMYTILLVVLPFWRAILKLALRVGHSEESKKRRTLVVGTGETALSIAGKLKSSLSSIHHVIGIIGLTRKMVGQKLFNFEVLGSIENIKKIVLAHKIEKVIFVSEEISFEQLFGAVSSCQGINVNFVVAGSEQDFLVGKSSVTMLDDIPLMDVQYNISALPNRIAKALFDIFLSVPILLLVYPFVYFYQKLIRNNNDFVNFVLGVPKVLTLKRSFVGPRSISSTDKLYLGRIGLTGLWNTEYLDKSDLEEQNKLNIYYAKNQNIWMDLEILGKTFAKMFE
jgi:GT2 family glycosyltransferase